MLKIHKMHLSLIATVAALGATSMLTTPPARAQVKPVGPPAAAQGWHAVTVAQGLRHPWGIASKGR